MARDLFGSLGGLYGELNCCRLSLAERGALWTLMAFEWCVLTEGTLVLTLGEKWRELVEALRVNGNGVLEEVGVDYEGRALYRWRHTEGAQERSRARTRERKRAERAARCDGAAEAARFDSGR